MNIIKVLKSFDIFNSEAVRFLKNRALNIFLVESPSLNQSGVNLSSDNNSININVINRPKTYNLLISAQRKIEAKKQAAKQVAKL